jgi:hypothetical protein
VNLADLFGGRDMDWAGQLGIHGDLAGITLAVRQDEFALFRRIVPDKFTRHAGIYLNEGCDMDDVAAAIFFGTVLATIFSIIFTVYAVKVARRLCALLGVLQREAEWRVRVNYELPGPMPLGEGKFPES